MRHPLRVVALLGALLPGLLGVAQAADVDAATYGYPLINPFEATITTTPEALRPELPKNSSIDQDEYTINLRPERQYQLPDNFWPVKKFHYILARQSHPAPLIFIIAGTGANYAASTVDYLKRLYYSAGYHVVQVSSPTSWDFMASASRTATPGYTPQDAEDLYRAMQAIRAQHPKLPVTEYFLTGYSLGGLDAAFVAQLDESMRSFNFKRVLMVNPPVNLLTSVRNLDRLVQTEVKGVTNTRTFYELILAKLTRYFREKGYVDFNDAVVQDLQGSPERLSNEEMAMLIGSVFRFSAADISFTADLINRRGLITPPNYPITEGTSLTPFLARSLQCDFDCYMTEQVLPFWQKAFKGHAVSQLAYQSSLPALEDYLRTSKKIGVMHNADDIILGPGDLGFLRKTFGDRLTVYPYGGHCGNINYRVNANAMLEFFARG